jgi:hypothetical protein
MPERVESLRRTWMDRHPNWEFRVWRLEDLRWLRNQRLFDRARPFSQKADLARYEIINRFGGVYLDTDMECLRPIEPLVDGCAFFSGREPAGNVAAGIFGAIPSHPIMQEVICRLPVSCLVNPPDQLGLTTGPQLLDRTIREGAWEGKPGVRVFPPAFFYPYDFYEPWRHEETFPRAYAAHHWGHSWKGQRGVSPDLMDVLPREGDAFGLWRRAVWREGMGRVARSGRRRLVIPVKRAAKQAVERLMPVPPPVHGLHWGPGEVLISTSFATRLLCPTSDFAMASELALTGTYDRILTVFLGRGLRRGMTFIDVDAGIGFFSILAAASVAPGRVFAYESEPTRLEFLRRNVAMNRFHDRVRVITKTAWRDDETVDTVRESLDTGLRGVSFIDIVRLDVTSDAAAVLHGMSEMLDEQRVGAIAMVYDASLLPEERWEATEKALTSLVEDHDATLHVPGDPRAIPLDEAHTGFRYPHLLVRFPGASINP